MIFTRKSVSSNKQTNILQNVPWQHHFNDQEIAILHLFAVSKKFWGHGIAGETLITLQKQMDKKSSI